MNRNPDGSLLTNDQLFDFAVQGGANPAKLRDLLVTLHSANLIRSELLSASAKVRFHDTTLLLDTRNTWTPAPPAEPDLTVFNFLTKA